MARRADAGLRLRALLRQVDPRDVATRYAADVVAGKVPAGQLHIAACRRHLQDLRDQRVSGWRWDVELVLRFQQFCSLVPIPDKPELRFDLQPWQVFALGSILGWVDAEGRRRFRRAYVEVARKNAKTLMLAVFVLYLCFFTGVIRAEAYCIATKLDQAKIVYNYASDIVAAVPELTAKKEGTIVEFGGKGPRAIPRLYDTVTGAKLEPLAADSKKADGLNPLVFVADELHEHPDSKLVDKMRTGQGARTEPLQVAITTAGDDLTSYCYRVRTRGAAVVNGQVEDQRSFVFICHRDEKDRWWSKIALQKANPNLGISVQWSFLEDEVKRARSDPSEENTVRRMYLSDWVSQTVRVIPMARWDACRSPPILESLKGRRCFGALDLSRARDMTAFGLLFPPREDQARRVLVEGLSQLSGPPQERAHQLGELLAKANASREPWTFLVWFWVPEEAAKQRERRNLQTYDLWAKQGHVTIQAGDTIDFLAVKQFIVAQSEIYDIRLIGYDPWGATQLAQELDAEFGLELVRVRQTMEHMAEPSGLFLDMVKKGLFAHGGHSVLRWMAENSEKKADSQGAWKFVKPKNPEKKVDGIIAAVMALHCATLTDEAQYSDQREALTLNIPGLA